MVFTKGDPVSWGRDDPNADRLGEALVKCGATKKSVITNMAHHSAYSLVGIPTSSTGHEEYDQYVMVFEMFMFRLLILYTVAVIFHT